MERFLSNYKAALPEKKALKTSKTEQEKSGKYESNKRKIAFNPSWKESFFVATIYHVMNSEGKIFCAQHWYM